MTARDINVIRELAKQYMKIAMSDCYVWKSVEALGNEYVLSYKPNVVKVANVTVSYVIRCEITETVEAAQKFGCPMDFTFKDISTVN